MQRPHGIRMGRTRLHAEYRFAVSSFQDVKTDQLGYGSRRDFSGNHLANQFVQVCHEPLSIEETGQPGNCVPAPIAFRSSGTPDTLPCALPGLYGQWFAAQVFQYRKTRSPIAGGHLNGQSLKMLKVPFPRSDIPWMIPRNCSGLARRMSPQL